MRPKFPELRNPLAKLVRYIVPRSRRLLISMKSGRRTTSHLSSLRNGWTDPVCTPAISVRIAVQMGVDVPPSASVASRLSPRTLDLFRLKETIQYSRREVLADVQQSRRTTQRAPKRPVNDFPMEISSPMAGYQKVCPILVTLARQMRVRGSTCAGRAPRRVFEQ